VVSGALRTLTPSRVEPSEVRRVTEEVLAGPAFDAAEPGLFQRVLWWALERLARLIELLGQGDGGTIVGAVILAGAIGAVVIIAVVLLRRVRRDPGVDAHATGFGGRTAQDWHELARRAEAAGEWDAALRCSYRALLSELVAAGITDEVVGRTARDYLRDVTDAAPAAQPPLTWMTTAFEATWYDRRPVDPTDLDTMRSAADEVRRAALVTR
jgi:hypothetical protein